MVGASGFAFDNNVRRQTPRGAFSFEKEYRPLQIFICFVLYIFTENELNIFFQVKKKKNKKHKKNNQ